MNIIFITRCYKPTNIQRIKDNLLEVFSNQDKISYIQYLLVDLSYNEPLQNFKCFEDEHTKVHFTYLKKDYYNTFGIDQVVQAVSSDLNSWVYILDDDNLITKNFLSIFDNYLGEEVLLADNNAYRYVYPPDIGKVIGKIDISNYVVKLNIFKDNHIYIEGNKSYLSDGAYFELLLKKQYKVKCTKQYIVTKSALSRPLNVLRRDL